MEFLQSALTSHKTTLVGLGMIVGALVAVANGASVGDEAVVTGFLGGIGLLLAKDSNVTGGTKAATKEAEARTKQE